MVCVPRTTRSHDGTIPKNIEVKLTYFQLNLERMRNLLEIDFLNRWDQQKLIDNSMKLSRIKTLVLVSFITYRENIYFL